MASKAGLLALTLALSGAAWAKGESKADGGKLGQQQLSELEKFRADYEQAMNEGDFDELKKMYSKEAVGVSADGQRLNGRDQIISSLEAATAPGVGQNHFAIKSLRPLGKDMALVTVTQRVEGGQSGMPDQIDIVSVTEKERGKWKIVDFRMFPAQGAGQSAMGGAGSAGAPAIVPSESTSAGVTPQRRAEIEKINERFETAWNNKDSAAMSKLWSQQAILVQPDGEKLTGREQIVPKVAGREEPLPRSDFAVENVRMLRDDLAVVAIRQEVSEPVAGMPNSFDVVSVVRREGADWKIVDARVFPASEPEHLQGVGGGGTQGMEPPPAPGSKTPQRPDGAERQPGSGPEP